MADKLRTDGGNDRHRPIVLVLDRDTPSRRRLCFHLKRQIDAPYRVESCDLLDPSAAAGLDAFVDRTAVCLFGLTQTRELERHVWPQTTTFYLLSDENGSHTVDRYQDMSVLAGQILPGQNGAGSVAGGESDLSRLDLVLSFDRPVRDAWLDEVISARLDAGAETYFLPLMPTFLVPDLELQEEGETLADFLLTLDAEGDDDINALGRCFFRHRRGYLVPRLPERADDLVSAGPERLSALLACLRRRLAASAPGTLAIAVCDGIALSVVSRLAAHADRLWIDAPNEANASSAVLARREIALLLAEIPSSCRVFEIRRQERAV